MKEILLFTGGTDSFIAWYYLGKPNGLYIDLGHRYHKKERRNAIVLARKMGMNLIVEDCLKLDKWEKEDADIPQRNMFLSMIASYYGDRIYMITQRGELSIPDRSPEFFDEATKMLTFLHGKYKEVVTPFLNMTKQDMVTWYKIQGLDLDLLKQTRGCFSKEEGSCGNCPACFRQWIAFAYNDIPLTFNRDITKWEGIKEYKQKMLDGKYEKRRTEQTLEFLKRYKI